MMAQLNGKINDADQPQWKMGAYRTTLTTVGTLIYGLRSMGWFPKYKLDRVAVAKAMRWLLGFFCFVLVFLASTRLYLPRNAYIPFFFLFFYGILILPLSLLALRIINYDCLSMTLGVLAILLAAAGLQRAFAGIGAGSATNDEALPPASQTDAEPPTPADNKVRRGLSHARNTLRELKTPSGLCVLAVIIGALAAQEKFIASPALFLAMLALPLAHSFPGGKFSRHQWALSVAAALLIPLLITYSSAIIFAATWTAHPITEAVTLTVSPLVYHFALAFDGFGKSQSILLAVATTIAAVSLLPLLLNRMSPLLRKRLHRQSLKVLPYLGPANRAILMGIAIIGLVFAQRFPAYSHPHVPVAEGAYFPGGSFNDVTTHYGAKTRLGHLTIKTVTTYCGVAITIPSAFTLLAIGCLVCVLRTRALAASREIALLELVSLGALLIPLAYIITGTPVGGRYLNLFIVGALLVVLVRGASLVAGLLSRRWQAVLVTAFCLLQVAELQAFRPIMTTFWPVWANRKPLASHTIPRVAESGGEPMGWGESAMLAGKRLQAMRASGQLPGAEEGMRIWMTYNGDWVGRPDDTECHWFRTRPARSLPFTDADFYVLTRMAVQQQRIVFPKDLPPLFTIAYRGVVMSWVYRGTELKEFFDAENCTFRRYDGHCWLAYMPAAAKFGDTPEKRHHSPLVVMENGVLLGPPHIEPEVIAAEGAGRFLHWQKHVYFSTSGNSNPNTNGRKYTLVMPKDKRD